LLTAQTRPGESGLIWTAWPDNPASISATSHLRVGLDLAATIHGTVSLMPHLRVRLPALRHTYEIKIGPGLLSEIGSQARASLRPDASRIAVISNRTVFNLYGENVMKSLRRAGFFPVHWLMKDGERFKSLSSLEQALTFLSQARLERSDAVIALGGGVVGDLAGFAAATYLRGVAFIQAPTTLLAQIDASIGGKTAVNLSSGKNLVGAFHQPNLVVIDSDTLATLPARELTAGWCEAVKQGAAGDRKLFDRTVSFLRNHGPQFSQDANGSKAQTQACAAIAAHCRFKASVVAGDEREDIQRTDYRSRRILNFGHTTGHALESVTRYRRFRHGEAVGYGMLVAAEMSKSLGMLSLDEVELLREAITLCGPLPRANDLAIEQIMRAMTTDKKSVRGATKWVLLERLGRARIVDGGKISARVLRAALRVGLQSFS
jgi:3-dehydroquinate synthase